MSAAAVFERLFRAWAGFARRGAWVVLMLALLGTGLTVKFLADNLAINTDTTDMLSAECSGSPILL